MRGFGKMHHGFKRVFPLHKVGQKIKVDVDEETITRIGDNLPADASLTLPTNAELMKTVLKMFRHFCRALKVN